MDMYQAAKHWECWAPTPAAAPFGPRNTIGTEMVPADMYSVLAAVLTMWSMACIEKLNVINSTTGLRPIIAAPHARPVKPASVMGVSLTRSAPKRCNRPFVILYAPW